MKTLNEISVETVCNINESSFESLEKITRLMRIMGIVKGYETGHSTHGSYLKFIGEFHAIDLSTGEVSLGTTAFLPSPVGSMLKSQIDVLGKNGKSVTFAFDVHVAPNEKPKVGFHYWGRFLSECKVSDPLAELVAKHTVSSVSFNVEMK